MIWFNSSSGDVQIWEMQNGQLANVVDVGPHPAGYSIVGSADFTGDGTDDILWFNPTTNHVDLWKMQDSHWAGSVDMGRIRQDGSPSKSVTATATASPMSGGARGRPAL